MKATPKKSAFRRAFLAAKKIPNKPPAQRKQRVHAWAEFVRAALRDEDEDGVK